MNTEEKFVCVIEDNKPIRKLFCTLLQKSNFKTIDFADGKSALDWLKENEPLAVITDILLPDVNGSDILSFVRNKENGHKIPVIAVTGFAMQNDKDKYINMGFDLYIPKPINTSSFAEDIKSIIMQKQ